MGKHEKDFHPACSNKIFGQPDPPSFSFSKADFEKLALELIKNHTAVTGVQPKLSLIF